MSTIRSASIIMAVAALAVPAVAGAQTSSESPFSMHGYLTQGFAAAGSLPLMGIPTAGTADYRALAIQVRYRIDEKSSVVTQVSHRRLGSSPLAVLEPSIELDWAFYRRLVGPMTLSVGRIPIPRGFYNEIRDVGTLLPFYRAPVSIYPEGTESVDGVAVTTAVDVGGWSVELNAFGGGTEWKAAVSDGEQVVPLHERSEKNFGSQLWLATPVRGTRVGFALTSIQDTTSDSGRRTIWTASAEVDRDRWMLRSEYTRLTVLDVDVAAGYVHGRFDVMPSVSLTAQYEQTDLGMVVFDTRVDWTEAKDAALGIGYALSPQLIFKLEGHRFKGYAYDVPLDRTRAAPVNYYGILSASVSF